MHSFEFRGLPVRYLRQGRGEPALLIHNGGTSSAIWQGVLPRLAETHEVFALDLPGFGASPQPRPGYQLENLIDLLERFIEVHQLAPVRLVGNCMGSAMALGLATRQHPLVHSMVLINPLTEATFAAGWLGSTLRLRKRAPALSHRLYRGLGKLTLPALVGEQALAFQFGRIGRALRLQQMPELQACFTRKGQVESLLGVLDDVANYARFDSLEAEADLPPLCTIWGLENRVLSAAAGRRLNERLRPQRQEWLKGCGHLAMLERPEEVADIIRNFFAETAQRRHSR